MDEAIRNKRGRVLKTRDSAANATGDYIDEMARERMMIKWNSRDGLGNEVLKGGSGNEVEKLFAPQISIR